MKPENKQIFTFLQYQKLMSKHLFVHIFPALFILTKEDHIQRKNE